MNERLGTVNQFIFLCQITKYLCTIWNSYIKYIFWTSPFNFPLYIPSFFWFYCYSDYSSFPSCSLYFNLLLGIIPLPIHATHYLNLSVYTTLLLFIIYSSLCKNIASNSLDLLCNKKNTIVILLSQYILRINVC